MGLDTYAAVRTHILERALEDSEDSEGSFYALAEDALVEAWRDLAMRWPILEWVKNPPGAFRTTDDITTTTITIATAGESVACTLSAAPSASITGRKIAPSGVEWYAIVTAHNAGETGCTLDVAQATIAAGTACVIYQDEYTLASDLGLFVDGLWYPNGTFVPLKSEEFVRASYSPPQGDGVPACFARIGQRTIRLSHYPTSNKRVEYPYSSVPADPSGTGTLALPSHWRPAYAELGLALLLGMKYDRRAEATMVHAERLIERAILYERRRVQGLQTTDPVRFVGAYGS